MRKMEEFKYPRDFHAPLDERYVVSIERNLRSDKPYENVREHMQHFRGQLSGEQARYLYRLFKQRLPFAFDEQLCILYFLLLDIIYPEDHDSFAIEVVDEHWMSIESDPRWLYYLFFRGRGNDRVMRHVFSILLRETPPMGWKETLDEIYLYPSRLRLFLPNLWIISACNVQWSSNPDYLLEGTGVAPYTVTRELLSSLKGNTLYRVYVYALHAQFDVLFYRVPGYEERVRKFLDDRITRELLGFELTERGQHRMKFLKKYIPIGGWYHWDLAKDIYRDHKYGTVQEVRVEMENTNYYLHIHYIP